jgi:hypothetical protein
MSNELVLYGRNLPSVNFLLFQQTTLVETIVGVQNQTISELWTGEIPGTTPPGDYLIVAESDSKVVGEETIYWNGETVIPLTKQLLEIYKIHGLDNTTPLQVSSIQRTAGDDIIQTLVIEQGTTTVTRTSA